MENLEIEKMNIYQRMFHVIAELEPIGKSLRVEDSDNTYSAMSEKDVLTAIKPLETKYRIFSYPANHTFDNQIVRTDLGGSGYVCHAEVTYRFVNIDDPTDYIEVVSMGTGLDTGDKAPGKAMTYADKYALMKAYKVHAGVADDPDSKASPRHDLFESFENNNFQYDNKMPWDDEPQGFETYMK